MRVLVIGLGAFGVWYSKTMRELGHEVIAIDQDETLVDRHVDTVSRGVVGDATDRALLERIIGSHLDAAVIAAGEDLAATILAFMALRELGVEQIYAKAHSVEAARALEQLGVTEAVFPELESGARLAHRMLSKSILEYTAIGEGVSIQEISVPKSWEGRSILQIEPREAHGLQIVAVRDSLTGELALPPDPAQVLTPSHSLLIAGQDEKLERITSAEDSKEKG
ncbi:MAG TPA: TrkA family potassium uptake protein [Myxococcota bacterium]|nr:TrkA family potassium uptake protein [Myxococcota bacterium]